MTMTRRGDGRNARNLRIPLLGAAVLALLGLSGSAAAAVTLPSLFGDHMVVQRDMAVPIWGTASANENIGVRLGSQEGTVRAGADGKWMVRVPAQPAGGPFDMVVTGTSIVTVRDVYVGEVWIASGQSNMDFRVHCTFAGCVLNNEAQEIAAADYPLIRSANIPFAPSATPATSATTSWLVSSPATVAQFSAAAYFFARELHNHLPNVAIGMIHASFGASTIQCWMSRESIAAIPSVATLLTQFEAAAAPNFADQHNPYVCYNGQINPLIPYGIRGVIWYQGESVTWGGDTYRDLQVGQINAWRRAWGQDFTFLISQLANYNVSTGGWPVLREAQLQATQIIPNTGLAVTIDIGEAANVHYGDKQDVGLRLGIAARGITYGQAIPYSGPIYDHMAIEGGAIRLFFTHTEPALTFRGNVGLGFEIAGANNVYAPATARIENDTVVVSSAAVPAPTSARYAWAGFPMSSLYSGGTPALPASPFRTNGPALPPPIVVGGPDGGGDARGSPDGGLVPDRPSTDGSATDGGAAVDGSVSADGPAAGVDAAAPSDGPLTVSDSSVSPVDRAPVDSIATAADALPLDRSGPPADSGTGDTAVPATDAGGTTGGTTGGKTGGGCSCTVANRGNDLQGLATLAAGWLFVLTRVRRRSRAKAVAKASANSP